MSGYVKHSGLNKNTIEQTVPHPLKCVGTKTKKTTKIKHNRLTPSELFSKDRRAVGVIGRQRGLGMCEFVRVSLCVCVPVSVCVCVSVHVRGLKSPRACPLSHTNTPPRDRQSSHIHNYTHAHTHRHTHTQTHTRTNSQSLNPAGNY